MLNAVLSWTRPQCVTVSNLQNDRVILYDNADVITAWFVWLLRLLISLLSAHARKNEKWWNGPCYIVLFVFQFQFKMMIILGAVSLTFQALHASAWVCIHEQNLWDIERCIYTTIGLWLVVDDDLSMDWA